MKAQALFASICLNLSYSFFHDNDDMFSRKILHKAEDCQSEKDRVTNNMYNKVKSNKNRCSF